MSNSEAPTDASLEIALDTSFAPLDADAPPPALHIEDGWLRGEPVRSMPAHSSWYGAMSVATPQGIMAHYTSTGAGTAETMARRRMRERRESDRNTSWHVTVDLDGVLWQMLSFHSAGRHCRRGQVFDESGAFHRINSAVLGIELEGFGRAFTRKQSAAAQALWRALVEEYNIGCHHAMLQHSVYDPNRRSDPGAVWMEKHAPRVLAYAFAAA